MPKILIATDSFDQVNGVSTTYRNILKFSHVETLIIHPGMFNWTTFRVYPEVQICTEPFRAYQKIKSIQPTHIHIGTEGPIGLAARIYCKIHNIPYTTGYHTKFPEYLWKLARIPCAMTYTYLKIFHNDSKAILTPSLSSKKELEQRGFNHVHVWTRGVSSELISQKKIVKHKNPPPGISESYFIAKKIVLGQLTPNEQKQALLEADLLRNLNHINITSYKGSFIDKDVLIIIMEFCESK